MLFAPHLMLVRKTKVYAPHEHEMAANRHVLDTQSVSPFSITNMQLIPAGDARTTHARCTRTKYPREILAIWSPTSTLVSSEKEWGRDGLPSARMRAG